VEYDKSSVNTFIFQRKHFVSCICSIHQKNDARLWKPLSLLCCSRSYKCSSGWSISKAALLFGNLRVYEPSTLWKKPSASSEETSDSQKKPFILWSSCATNTRSECALNVGVILFWHVPYIRYLGMQLPSKFMHVRWYILCRWVVVLEPDELGVSLRDLAMQSAPCKDEKMECKLTQDERAACVEGVLFYSHQQTLPAYLKTPDYAQGIVCA